MTLRAADGSTSSWEIVQSAAGGFDATYRVERNVGGLAYAEADQRHFLSRDVALGWLRSVAAIRGFDGRETTGDGMLIECMAGVRLTAALRVLSLPVLGHEILDDLTRFGEKRCPRDGVDHV